MGARRYGPRDEVDTIPLTTLTLGGSLQPVSDAMLVNQDDTSTVHMVFRGDVAPTSTVIPGSVCP